jgi:hypothetical protein
MVDGAQHQSKDRSSEIDLIFGHGRRADMAISLATGLGPPQKKTDVEQAGN